MHRNRWGRSLEGNAVAPVGLETDGREQHAFGISNTGWLGLEGMVIVARGGGGW